MYASKDGGQSNLVAEETWTPTLWWSKRDVKQKNGSLNSKHGFSGSFCEDCVIGKQTRNSFQKTAIYRATKLLELVHTDICGPITPKSYSSKRYFLTFINDYSRRTCVYFLNEKSEVLKVFKKFKMLVEKKIGKNIKALRSYRGGEYTSNAFTEYCEEQGIRRFLTTSYSPQ